MRSKAGVDPQGGRILRIVSDSCRTYGRMTLALGVSDTSGRWGCAVGFQFLVTNSLGYPFILSTWVTHSFSLALSGKSVQILSARVSRVRATLSMHCLVYIYRICYCMHCRKCQL